MEKLSITFGRRQVRGPLCGGRGEAGLRYCWGGGGCGNKKAGRRWLWAPGLQTPQGLWVREGFQPASTGNVF